MNLTITERLRRKIANLVPVGIRPMRLATGTLSITIDDFPKNAWENGRPIFERHDVKATFYVSGGLCEKNWLGLPQYDVSTLRAVHGSGHEIACHTFDHINCVRSSPQALGVSIERNRMFVNDVLPDVALKNFAFPTAIWPTPQNCGRHSDLFHAAAFALASIPAASKHPICLPWGWSSGRCTSMTFLG